MIVWVASYPRSGNTFTRMAIKYLCDKNTYDIYLEPQTNISPHMGQVTNRSHINVKKMHESDEIYFVKTHEMPNDPRHGQIKAPALYIVRDGRDALVSFAHFNLKGQKYNKQRYNQELRNLVASSRWNWSQHIQIWNQYQPKAIVRYEDIVKNPYNELLRAFGELNLDVPIKDVKVPDFKSMNKMRPDHFRRGISGSWKDEMPADIHKAYWDKHKASMKLVGYGEN